MTEAPRNGRRSQFNPLADVSTSAMAKTVLRRHWGGWLVAGAYGLTSGLSLWSARSADYDLILVGASLYHGGLALAAGGLTWLLARRSQSWAGLCLLGIVAWSVLNAFLAASGDAEAPPTSPYLYLRLLAVLSIVNAIRANRSIKRAESTELAARDVRLRKLWRPSFRLQLGRSQRLWAFSSFCWVVVVGFGLLVFDSRADVVGGEPWKIFALFIGPPLFGGIGAFAYRQFVVAPLAADERTSSDRAGPAPAHKLPFFKIGTLAWIATALGASVAIWGAFITLGAELERPMIEEVPADLDGIEERQRLQISAQPAPLVLDPIFVLDPILDFEQPSECQFGSRLMQIRDAMIGYENGRMVPGEPFRIEGYPTLLRPTFEREDDGWVTSSVPMSGLWHGLRVSRVYQEALFHSYVQIRFLESPEEVRTVLNGVGFDLPAVGERSETTGEGMTFSRGVSAVPGGAALHCG